MTRQATEDEQKRYEAEILKHQQEAIQENNKQYYRKLNTDTPNIIQDLDKPIYDAVNKLIHTKTPLVIIEGKAGNGKSTAIDLTIAKEGAGNKTNIYTTRLSQPYLYRIAHNNQTEGEIIILRDINPFRKDLLDMLKALTETKEPRKIHKNTYSKQNADLPPEFEFKGKILIEVNAIPQGDTDLKNDIEALMSRAHYVPFHLSLPEIKAKMRAIATTDWQKEVTEELLKIKGIQYNLRTQWHAFRTYELAKKKGTNYRQTMEEDLKRLSHPPEYFRVYALIGENYVTKQELIKMLVTSEKYGIKTAKRRIQDLMDAGILYEIGKQVGLKTIKELEKE